MQQLETTICSKDETDSHIKTSLTELRKKRQEIVKFYRDKVCKGVKKAPLALVQVYSPIDLDFCYITCGVLRLFLSVCKIPFI